MKRVGEHVCWWLLLCLLAAPSSAQVVITELMYHPGSDLDGDEFIEIHNPTGSPVDLTGWCFEGVVLCFDPGDEILANAYLVLGPEGGQTDATYSVTPYRTYTLSVLNDNGERLALLDSVPAVVDEVTFDDGPPWPVTPDGLGPSLQLIDVLEDNDTPQNWRASVVGPFFTPGAANSVAAVGLPPWISDVQHTLDPQPLIDPIDVTATVEGAVSVDLTYLIGPQSAAVEVTLPMSDQGGNEWSLPGGSEIPSQPAGTLVRYRITATGPTGQMEYPRDDDTVEYDGTVVLDPGLTSQLPIFHWFMDDTDYQNATCKDPEPPCHVLTDDTEPAVLFYDGKLYDAVQVRVRGQSSRTWKKKHWKFFFPQGHNFTAPGLIEREVDTFNLQSSFADKSFLREVLAWESFRDGGAPYNQAFSARVEQNGQFFGLYTYLEAPDADWVKRNGLSPAGARYKANGNLAAVSMELLEGLYEKTSRLDEDYSDLFDFVNGINLSPGQAATDYVYDNVDIATTINYIAIQTVMHDNDHVRKNYYLYRDTVGTERWTMHAWDLDLTFGKNFTGDTVFEDVIWADQDTLPGYPSYISPGHPLFGTFNRRKVDDLWNHFIDRVLSIEEIRTMYFRRLRSLMDELLAPGLYEARIDALIPLIEPEATLDALQSWGQEGASQDVFEATDILKNDYLAPRRVHLFETHSACDLEIPPPQPALPEILITEIMYDPPGGTGAEYVELYNPSSSDAVDLSGWRLDGVALTMPPGTVIPPETYALFVSNDPLFRMTYGGGKLVLAWYKGGLSNLGESLVLRNQFGGVVSSVSYDEELPWPAASGGSSLALVDLGQGSDKVANWAVSTTGTPGAANTDVAATLPPIPELYINEVLADNATINQDNLGEFDPWVELHNRASQTIDLGALFLSDDQLTPNKWQFPSGTEICGGCWLLVWADNQTGQGPLPPHTNFSLSPGGGFVGLYDSIGTLIDYLTYPALPADHSLGRFPDGTAEQRVFSVVTPEAANEVPTSPLILNEYNAVHPDKELENDNSDTYWGDQEGNGGDWFELVVTSDHLNVQGWKLVLTDDTGGAGETTQTLTLSLTEPLWFDLRAGTILTVSEELVTDVSFDPVGTNDWWINVQAANGADGQYVTAQDFEVSNKNWQLTITDADDAVIFGPAGEGVMPLSGVNDREVFKLEEDPGPYLTPVADYNDGTSSTFGSPNVYAAGTIEQDFTALREIGVTEPCTIPDTDGDLVCDQEDNCPETPNLVQVDTDADGQGDSCDICPDDPFDDIDQDGVCGNLDNCPLTHNPNPQADGDADDVGDICDNCLSDWNEDQADDDGDGIGNACDACPADPINDPDGDLVCHNVDNCPNDANPQQEDGDADGIGDACDLCPGDPLDDIDLDGYCVGTGFDSAWKDGDQDNCPTVPNVDQLDGDTDLIGDLCDNCPADTNGTQADQDGDALGDACDPDIDGDGVANGLDNCPVHSNPDQTDTDGDLEGDACDLDDDGDGEPDVADNCPTNDIPDQTDTDGDGVGDVCDCAPSNPSLSAVPGQLGPTLRLDRTGGTTLHWARAYQGHTSNVYRGTFVAGQAWAYDESCLAMEHPGTALGDAAEPLSGEGFYYLVSGRNLCGEGPAGLVGDGSPIEPSPTCASGAVDTNSDGYGDSCPGCADADSDGNVDLADNCASLANSNQLDEDQGFVGNVCDNCDLVVNPTQEDLDQDGAGDACDLDDDGDGVPDVTDNCPRQANAGQEDADLDSVGDACDPCTDLDGDGLGDAGYPGTCNPDPFPDDPDNDADADGIAGPFDNCLDDANPGQEDEDGDGLGDACDGCPGDPDNDIDGDGVCAGQCGAVETQAGFAAIQEQVLVQDGASMVYLANHTQDPGLGLSWTAPGYVPDESWTAGTYGIGYEVGTGAQGLIQTSVPLGTVSVYTRVEFEITGDPAELVDVHLGADYDDGFVAWINGLQVYRSPEMPVGVAQWNTEPSSHESGNGTEPDYGLLIDITDSAKMVLQSGTNVLAIGVWNHIPFTPPSDDLVLVPRLSINRVPTMTYLANTDDPDLAMGWVEEIFDDSGWGAGIYGVGFEAAPLGQPTADDLIETEVQDFSISIYTRAGIEIEDVQRVDEVFLAADYDDGFVAWINGTEIFRSPQMPEGALAWNTEPNSHESSNGVVPDLGPPLSVSAFAIPALHDGTNVLALAVWNENPVSTDLVLVPSLAITSTLADNCPTNFNPNQADQDDDGVGDLCDNCPADFNPAQTDLDGDGVGNACD